MTSVAVPVARTPLHAWHQAHGARFREEDGWLVVSAYSGAESEAASARAGLGMADISACAKFAWLRPGVSALARSLLADGADLPCGKVAAIPGESGLACRLTDDHLLLLYGGPTPRRRDLPGATAVATDVTSAYAGFALIGPRLEEYLRRLTHLDVRPTAFPPGSCAETPFGGVEALLVRPPAGSLPTLQVLVAWDLGEYVWERMLDAASDVPITPLGLGARAILRSEGR
jgi:sarcosine oxidase subunit alpha